MAGQSTAAIIQVCGCRGPERTGGDHRGGTGKRNDRLDGSREGQGPAERKVAEVSALVLRS